MEQDIQKQLDRVFGHIETYNREMGGVLTSIRNIEKGMGDMCASIKAVEKKVDNAITNSSKALPPWAVAIIGLLMGGVGWLAK